MDVLSVEQLREFDLRVQLEYGLSERLLIENAARSALEVILAEDDSDRYVVFAGCGNNGADGLALARHLHVRAKDVKVFISGPQEKCNAEFKFQLNVLKKLIPDCFISDADHIPADVPVIDAVFGIGFRGRITSQYARLFRTINKFSRIISLDVPSGVPADGGECDPAAVKADITISFIAGKKAFVDPACKNYCGKVLIKDIGI